MFLGIISNKYEEIPFKEKFNDFLVDYNVIAKSDLLHLQK